MWIYLNLMPSKQKILSIEMWIQIWGEICVSVIGERIEWMLKYTHTYTLRNEIRKIKKMWFGRIRLYDKWYGWSVSVLLLAYLPSHSFTLTTLNRIWTQKFALNFKCNFGNAIQSGTNSQTNLKIALNWFFYCITFQKWLESKERKKYFPVH